MNWEKCHEHNVRTMSTIASIARNLCAKKGEGSPSRCPRSPTILAPMKLKYTTVSKLAELGAKYNMAEEQLILFALRSFLELPHARNLGSMSLRNDLLDHLRTEMFNRDIH